MAKIIFKATRRLHDSGFRLLEKRGALNYDMDKNSKDGVWLYLKNGGRVMVDCDGKTGEFNLYFDEADFKTYS